MATHRFISGRIRSIRRIWILVLVLPLLVVGCGHLSMMFGTGAVPPPASEFGFGPRRSAHGLYAATIEPSEQLRVRRMHQVILSVRSADSTAVRDAAVEVDGGMPQHGHGLPTRPRVTKDLGDGRYLVDGVRFNMGGWWELTFGIATPVGTDTVTFNLDL